MGIQYPLQVMGIQYPLQVMGIQYPLQVMGIQYPLQGHYTNFDALSVVILFVKPILCHRSAISGLTISYKEEVQTRRAFLSRLKERLYIFTSSRTVHKHKGKIL